MRVGQRLINHIKNDQKDPHQELWKAELVVRASTRAGSESVKSGLHPPALHTGLEPVSSQPKSLG